MILEVLTGTAALGCALIGGVFFAFSSFVMPALMNLPAGQGAAAMLAINVTVINWHFLGLFLGTALLSLVLAGAAALGYGPVAPNVAGALLYCIGTFGVTGMRNVPLNDALVGGRISWTDFVQRWSRWNNLRGVAATLAAGCFVIGLHAAQG